MARTEVRRQAMPMMSAEWLLPRVRCAAFSALWRGAAVRRAR